MKNFTAVLFAVLFAWSASAQGTPSEPYLPPMGDYKFQPSGHTAILRARGMTVDDGYGPLSFYGAANLFGGTPAYEDFYKAVRSYRTGNCLLWSGIGVSTTGLVAMFVAAASGRPSGFDNDFFDSVDPGFWNSGGTFGVVMLVAGIPLITSGSVCIVKARKRMARAVDIYNEYTGAVPRSTRVSELSMGFTTGGIGLVYKF